MPGDPALGVRQTWACGSAPDGCVTVDKTTSEPDVAHLPTRTLSGVWGRIKGDNISLKETICKSVSTSISSPSSNFMKLLLALRLHVIGRSERP